MSCDDEPFSDRFARYEVRKPIGQSSNSTIGGTRHDTSKGLRGAKSGQHRVTTVEPVADEQKVPHPHRRLATDDDGIIGERAITRRSEPLEVAFPGFIGNIDESDRCSTAISSH